MSQRKAILYRMKLPTHECPYGLLARRMLEDSGYEIEEHLLTSRDQVDEALASPAMKAFALCAHAELWARHGTRHPLGDDFTGAQDIIPQALDKQTVLSLTANVPPSLLKECLLTGTPSDVIEQVAEWRDRGLQYPIIGNLSSLQPSLRRGLAANLPFTKILRRLRKL